MKINSYSIKIPFRSTVKHSLKARNFSESFIIVLEDESGIAGIGEGAPRPYVNGERLHQSIEWLSQILNHHPLPQCNGVDSLYLYISTLIDHYPCPSVICALELAMIDLLSKKANKPASDFIGFHGNIIPEYSVVLPQLDLQTFKKYCHTFNDQGFTEVKIKVGDDQDVDRVKTARLIFGDQVDIRLDANRAWTFSEALDRIPIFKNFGVAFIEEPLVEAEVDALPSLSKQVDIGLILDESIGKLEDVQYFSDRVSREKLIINLKLSKCGGFLNTSKIYKLAKSLSIPCQLGCNVGETGVLTAAGRCFARTHQLHYLEGAYSALIMEDDIMTPVLSYTDNMSIVESSTIGFGVEVQLEKFKKYTVNPLIV